MIVFIVGIATAISHQRHPVIENFSKTHGKMENVLNVAASEDLSNDDIEDAISNCIEHFRRIPLLRQLLIAE